MSTRSRTLAIMVVATALGTMALAARDALAITSHQARECKPNRGTDTNFDYYIGITYTSTTGSFHGIVGCPLSLGTQASGCVPVNDVVVRYEDGNSTRSLSCQITQSAFDGLVLFGGAPKFSCATAGGCASEGTSFVGKGYLRMVPSGTAVNNCIDQQYELQCNIPRPEPTFSRVFSYYAE
jgi:hypothetical protein